MSEELPPGLSSQMWSNAAMAARRDYDAQVRAALSANIMMNRTPPPEYHESLLNVSQRLIQDGQYQLAVVMAQAACEVYTEQIISALIDRVEPESLRDWIHPRARRANDLSDERVRELYLGLTGHKIDAGQGLWQEYVKHTQRRHGVVHRGVNVSKDEAKESYDTARQVIEYLRAQPMTATRTALEE